MSLAALIAVFGVAFAISLVVAMVVLKVSCRWLAIENVTLKRAAATYLLIFAAMIPVRLLFLWLDIIADDALPTLIALLAGQLFALFVIWVEIIRWRFKTTRGKASLATLMTSFTSLCFAVAVALGIRHFLVEAFVVPTGAMAPTVMGQHGDAVCQNCEYEYSVGMSSPGFREETFDSLESTCPMCGAGASIAREAAFRPGDRILADKTTAPHRFDLVVFKFPLEPEVTFIKRLVGMPGEKLQIDGGDLFIDGKRLRKPPGEFTDLWLTVHDTKFVPHKRQQHALRWEAGESSWKPTGTGGWRAAANEKGVAELALSDPIVDALPYNDLPWSRRPLEFVPIRDIRIALQLQKFDGPGGLEFVWECDGDRVQASVAADGSVEITHTPIELASEKTAAEPTLEKGSLKKKLADCKTLAFAHRDGQAYVVADGATAALLAIGSVEPSGVVDRSNPDVQKKENRLSIVLRDGEVAIERIRIDRDVYYTNIDEPFTSFGEELAPNPISLGDDEYFCLGDNSRQSNDCRFFGPVKADLMIGVARWIYWPPARWHEFQ